MEDIIHADPEQASLLSTEPDRTPSVDAYNCIVMEKGYLSLMEFMAKNKKRLDNIAKQSIMHQLIKGIDFLHSTGNLDCADVNYEYVREAWFAASNILTLGLSQY